MAISASTGPTPVQKSRPQQASAACPRRDVNVQLQYLADDPLYKYTKPLQVTPNFADRENRTNVRLSPGEFETLNDIRGRENQFTLDSNGFQYVKAPTTFAEWSSQPRIGQVYLQEMEDVLKREVDGCDEIIFYDARIRQEGKEGLRVEGLSYNPFARQVHVDNTESSIITKIRNLTEMKADYLLRGRARVINIWRPIKHPVYDCGLAVADGGKLQPSDLIECDRHRSDTGEFWDTMGVVKFRPGYSWWYMSEQDEEDVLLFKNYDSATDITSPYCLHTAFDVPPEVVPAGAPTRESIEVRALVFTHPPDARRMSTGTLLQQNTKIEHPLAISLQKGDLKRVDDEHSITDRLRKDIDEANEVKDAVLLLRQRNIRRLESVCDDLVQERDTMKAEMAQARDQVLAALSQVGLLQEEVSRLERVMGVNTAQILKPGIDKLAAQLSQIKLGH